MGSGKLAEARKPSSRRNNGHRKGPKSKNGGNDENIPPPASGTRPKPRPTYKRAVERDTTPTREDDAATALVLMGNPSSGSAPDASDIEHDDDIEIADVVEPAAEDLRDNAYDPAEDGDEDEFSGSDSEDDEELDKAVVQVIPKLKIPAAKVDIPFEVPYKNGTRDLTGITSRTSFDDFLRAVADKMQTRVSALNIGYFPSYKPKNTKAAPKLLETDNSWAVLITDVQQYIKSCQAKNRGKGEVKPFSILLVDMDQVDDAKGKSKGGKKGSKSKKDDSDDQPAATPALKEHELFKKIEKEHYCQECKSACVVLDNGDHHVLTHPELATWAMLASHHEAIVKDPPSQLDLGVSHARQKKAKNHRANTSSNSDESVPAWLQTLTPILGALVNNRLPATPDWHQSQYNMPVTDPRISVHVPHETSAAPSFAGTKRPAEDDPVLDVPDIATWLATLDADPVRGRLKLNFSQHKDLLLENGFFELSDVANVSAEQLQNVLKDKINFGIANRLVTHAKEDFTRKRARVD